MIIQAIDPVTGIWTKACIKDIGDGEIDVSWPRFDQRYDCTIPKEHARNQPPPTTTPTPTLEDMLSPNLSASYDANLKTIDASAIRNVNDDVLSSGTGVPKDDSMKKLKKFITNQLQISFTLEELATKRAKKINRKFKGSARDNEALSPRRLDAVLSRAQINYREAYESLRRGQIDEIVNHRCRKAKEKYQLLLSKQN